MDPKQVLHEGVPLQLRILRIDAERRRLGLSLRQADEPDAEVPAELSPLGSEPDARNATATAPTAPSLEDLAAHPESASPSLEGTAATPRRTEGKGERRDRANENPLLNGLPGELGETTAMAEAFRAAARQRSKEETEPATTEPTTPTTETPTEEQSS
jgi:small subunit ribosomal protein S1